MCRSCFSTFLLRDDCFKAGSAKAFGPGPLDATRRNFVAFSAAAAGAFAAAAGVRSAFAADAGADVIFTRGKIIPLPGAAPVEALAIGGGKILALGKRRTIEDLKSANTKIVDLDGRTMMPGFIDPHHHTILASLIFELLDDVGYANFATRGKLLAELRAIAARTPPGQWISCSNFDNLLQGGDLSREELDTISTSHPIFVWYTNGHDACVNSMALKIAGIADDVGTLPGGDISAGTTRAS